MSIVPRKCKDIPKVAGSVPMVSTSDQGMPAPAGCAPHIVGCTLYFGTFAEAEDGSLVEPGVPTEIDLSVRGEMRRVTCRSIEFLRGFPERHGSEVCVAVRP